MTTPTTLRTPLAQVERRTHELIEVTGYRVEHGHRVVDGVWATRNGLTVGPPATDSPSGPPASPRPSARR